MHKSVHSSAGPTPYKFEGCIYVKSLILMREAKKTFHPFIKLTVTLDKRLRPSLRDKGNLAVVELVRPFSYQYGTIQFFWFLQNSCQQLQQTVCTCITVEPHGDEFSSGHLFLEPSAVSAVYGGCKGSSKTNKTSLWYVVEQN